jgi:transposase
MKEYIALDAHKRYSFAEKEEIATGKVKYQRIEHKPGAIKRYLGGVEAGTRVAVEATGNWYWIVDEIEEAGCQPQLVHPYKAKVMMGCINKTDKLDVHGMNRLQRVGTLPTVWIAPKATRDLRELPRTRMFFSHMAHPFEEPHSSQPAQICAGGNRYSDAFGVKARQEMIRRIAQLPLYTKQMTDYLLQQLDLVSAQLANQEKQLRGMIPLMPEWQRLTTLPGVGVILAIVIGMEIGDVHRFFAAPPLGLICGDDAACIIKRRQNAYGALALRCEPLFEVGFLEAANCVCLHQDHFPNRHVTHLYRRVASRRGHQKAIGAVARHLAEAAFYVLSRQEDYREPCVQIRKTNKRKRKRDPRIESKGNSEE